MYAPARVFYLLISYGAVRVQYIGTHGGEITRLVSSAADWQNFLTSKANEAGVPVSDLQVFFSSSLDYPEEFQATPEAAALARQLRAA